MLKILKQLKCKEWIYITICTVIIFFQVWLDLKLPDYMKEITTLVQTSVDSMSQIYKAGFKMLLCAFGSLLLAFGVCFIAAKISSAVSYRLRNSVYNKVEDFSMEEIGEFSTSSLITRSTNDVTQVQSALVMGIQVLIKAPIMSIMAILKISGKSWQWSLGTSCAVFLMIILLLIIFFFAIPKFKVIQKLTDNLNKVTRENLTGVRVVRAFNAEKYQEKKFEKANSELTNTHLFTSKLMSIMMPTMTLILNGLALSIYWIGAYIINGSFLMDKINIFSDMMVYVSYAMQVVVSFILMVMFFILLPRATVSARRINEVLDKQPKIKDGKLSKLSNLVGEVEFKNVSFKYPNAKNYILKNVSFKASKGEVIAFIGSTGSGKSTLINLLPRFYDATEGEILIDGINVKDYKQYDLHNKIGYISQKTMIFSGDIQSNIVFGENGKKEPSNKDINFAISISQAKEFVDKLPNGINSHISQGGTNISGGQKQRLAIARAICRKPEIYIFDDSFSALDYKTDKKLRAELFSKVKDATVFIVAQRIGTIKDADKIVVLQSGEIVGIGKHKDLLKSCNVYKEIALSQLTMEELK